jgi:hypothetical protein
MAQVVMLSGHTVPGQAAVESFPLA